MLNQVLEDEPENIEQSASQSTHAFNALNVKMLGEREVGGVRPFMPALPPEGSAIGAAFRRHNVIGNYINSVDTDDFRDGPVEPGYNYLDHIPVDLWEKYGELYANTVNSEQASALTAQLHDELNDASVLHNAGWRGFLSVGLANLVDPTILLPGGTIYRSTKAAHGIAKSALSVSAASMASATVSEAVAHNTQLTRELDESIYGVIASGVVGAGIGGLGGSFAHGAVAKAANKQIVETLASEAPIGPQMTLDQSLSAMASRDPAYQKELNSLYGGTPTAAIGKFLGYVTQKLTPQGRLLFSPFASSRAIANEMLEHNLLLNANLPGKRKVIGADGKEIEIDRPAMSKGIAVESEIKSIERGMYRHLFDYQDIFYEQAGIKGPLKELQRKARKHAGLELGEWERQVWRTVVTGRQSQDASVQKAADLINKKFFEPITQEYIRLGVFSHDIKPKTAANYFMRVYNREKIRDPAQRGKTQAKFEAFIKRNNEELIALEPEIKRIEDELKALKVKAVAGDEAAGKAIKALEQELKDLVPHYLYDSEGQIRKVIDPDYYAVEAEKIIDNILGMGDKFNPLLQNLPVKRTSVFHERQFLIDDIEIEDELVTSFLEVAPMFIRATAPHVALLRYAERLGLEAGQEAKEFRVRHLEEDYKAAVAKNPKNEKKLFKRLQKDKQDIKDLFDILQGIYGAGVNTMDNAAARIVKNLSAWNYMRLMGQVTLQAFTDLGAIGLKHGFFRTIHSGVLPVLKELKEGSYDKSFLKDLNFATNTLQGNRLKAMLDQDPYAGQTGMFTRAIDYMSQRYGNLNLMNQWTDAMEFIAGKTSMARTLRAIDQWATTGTMKAKEATRLRELGINDAHWPVIHAQFKKHGGKTDGSYWVNWGKWDTQNDTLRALHEFKLATTKEIEATVVGGPGVGEKPKYARTPLGSLLFAFKGFSYGMTYKALIPGLQRGDAEFYQGLAMLGALSLMSYGATTLIRGEELDLEYDTLFKEMIDRSGITGVFGNAYNLGNKLGLIPGQEVTRYRGRGMWSTLLGPSAGIIEESQELLSKAMNSEVNLTTKDMNKFFRLWPYQNLWYTHRLNKMIAKDFADYLGFEESPQ